MSVNGSVGIGGIIAMVSDILSYVLQIGFIFLAWKIAGDASNPKGYKRGS